MSGKKRVTAGSETLRKDIEVLEKKLKQSESFNKTLIKYYTPNAPDELRISSTLDGGDALFQDSFEHAMERLTKYESGDNVASADKDALAEELKKVKDDLERTRSRLSSVQADSAKQTRQIDELMREKDDLETQLNVKQSERSDSRTSQTQQEVNELKTQLENARGSKEKLQEEMEDKIKKMEQNAEKEREEMKKRQIDLEKNVNEKEMSIKDLLERIQAFKDEQERTPKQDETDSLKETLDRSKRERDSLQQELSRLEDQGPTRTPAPSLDTDEDIKALRAELTETKCVVENLKAEKEDLQSKCHDAFVKLEAKDKHVKAETNRYEELLAKKESTINDLRRENSNLKLSDTGNGYSERDLKDASEEVVKLKVQNEAALKQIETLKRQKMDLEKTINDLRREASMHIGMGSGDDLKKKLEQKEKELTKLEDELKQTKRELEQAKRLPSSKEQKMRDEINSLKDRLSQVAGAQLMDNNPAIADLSDDNRALKLGERCSELYDNEWTDAYDEMDSAGKDEREITQDLLSILQNVYKVCNDVSVQQMQLLKESALSLPGSKGNTNIEIAVTKQRQLKELHKAFAKETLPLVTQICLKKLGQDYSGMPGVKGYFEACVGLCWYMSVQDPPVVFRDPATPGSIFDTDSYRVYTQSGKTVDYCVWPLMLLHHNGPTLLKGVAQGK